MLKLLLILFVLVSVCVAIHGLGMILGLRWLGRKRPALQHHHFSLPAMFWMIIRVVYGLLLLHLLQILVWAACYDVNGCFPDFTTSFYYSATSYSTVGYGDVNPPAGWRVLGAVEAVTGILMFGWSTGVLFSVVNHLLSRFKDVRHPDQTPG
ncbi:MAG: potassium channel family protein [Luteolibacter sp.]